VQGFTIKSRHNRIPPMKSINHTVPLPGGSLYVNSYEATKSRAVVANGKLGLHRVITKWRSNPTSPRRKLARPSKVRARGLHG